MTVRTKKKNDHSIIALDKFIRATRDSGYKGTASAVSELVDNSIQAGARSVEITIVDTDDGREVSVLDDGAGMDPFTLRQALRFGGSSRFDDRGGLGRYGMGLPNSSLSQARRVTVYTWQSPGKPARGRRRAVQPEKVYVSHLDVDEIAAGKMTEVPKPRIPRDPPEQCAGPSGTLVIWSRADRLDNKRISTLERKLADELGRRFRHYLWNKLRISINGKKTKPVDPLFLHPKARHTGGQPFGEEIMLEVRSHTTGEAGVVRVRFSELPVQQWQKLPNDEKRKLGISKGAGVSVVRAGREVDYGWFFMGGKRRENYDDWWRCEVHFEPVLDEVFGITHTKQQIRPMPHLLEALTPDLEAIARALNSRVRKAHLVAKATERFAESEKVAAERDRRLRPLPATPKPDAKELLRKLKRSHPQLRDGGKTNGGDTNYRIIEASVKDTSFFTWAAEKGEVVLVINPDHPFFREVYRPLVESESPELQAMRAKVELLLLAAARGEAAAARSKTKTLTQHRQEWSQTLAAFLSK